MKLYTEEQVKDLNYWKNNAEEDYLTTPISVLRYISELEKLTPIELPSDEELAILFHNKYEELAPKFGYETRMETKEFKKDSNNGKLMIAVCREILQLLNQNKDI